MGSPPIVWIAASRLRPVVGIEGKTTMDNNSYRVILEGGIQDGFDRADVVRRLMNVFKKDKEKIEKLLTTAPVSVAKGLPLDKAQKYVQVLERNGATCRIDPPPTSDPQSTATARTVRPVPQSTPPLPEKKPFVRPPATSDGALETVCPKCGYEAASDTDIMVVRGDCPRCGLLVNPSLREVVEDEPVPGEVDAGAQTDWNEVKTVLSSSLRSREDIDKLLGKRRPASDSKRAFATVVTFGTYLAAHLFLLLLILVTFYPFEDLPRMGGSTFFQTLGTMWPYFISGTSVFLVAFVVPLFNGGLTYGQAAAGIECLYTQEAQAGGLVYSLLVRTILILGISYIPGWTVLWLCGVLGLWTSPTISQLVMMAVVLVSWLVCWFWAGAKTTKRGPLDIAAGTVQVEAETGGPEDSALALWPYAVAVGLVAFFVIVLPLFDRLYR